MSPSWLLLCFILPLFLQRADRSTEQTRRRPTQMPRVQLLFVLLLARARARVPNTLAESPMANRSRRAVQQGGGLSPGVQPTPKRPPHAAHVVSKHDALNKPKKVSGARALPLLESNSSRLKEEAREEARAFERLASKWRGRGGLHPAAEHLAKCETWHAMMVPKTGSSLTADFITRSGVSSGPSSRCNGRIQWHFHPTLYIPCSLATLREPCSRVTSIYAHLRERYPKSWPGTAKTVNEFVVALHANWEEIHNRKISNWPAPDRHLVVAMPQYLWIGNASKVVCTERLDELLPATLREMGCAAVPNSTASVKGVAGTGNVHTAKSDQLSVKQANLSTASCTAVRKLYWQDWFLYQRQCLGRS